MVALHIWYGSFRLKRWHVLGFSSTKSRCCRACFKPKR